MKMCFVDASVIFNTSVKLIFKTVFLKCLRINMHTYKSLIRKIFTHKFSKITLITSTWKIIFFLKFFVKQNILFSYVFF